MTPPMQRNQIKDLQAKIKELERATTKDNLSSFYEWELERHSVEYEVEFLKNDKIDLQAKVEDLEKELLSLRSYCTLTFGESHPEIKKCVHEVELEQLKNKEKRDG